MATDKFNTLHLRFAAMCRDEVASVTTDGQDLLAADRTAYLNAAFAKYVSLLYQQYKDDMATLRQAFQTMFKYSAAVATEGTGIITSLPTDYGFFVALSKPKTGEETFGTPIIRATPEEWNALINDINPNFSASTTSPYCYPENTQISILPVAAYSGLRLSYIIKIFDVVVVTGAGGTDIPLDERHFNTLLAFAVSQYYRDKQEFQVSELYLADAYRLAPFKLEEKK
jgi:hypothetical protein